MNNGLAGILAIILATIATLAVLWLEAMLFGIELLPL